MFEHLYDEYVSHFPISGARLYMPRKNLD